MVQYGSDIVARYREILTCQDLVLGRNALHYAAMSKFTKSLKTLESLLDIQIDTVPAYDEFLKLYFQLQPLQSEAEKFDPRKSNAILKEFKNLMSPQDYN